MRKLFFFLVIFLLFSQEKFVQASESTHRMMVVLDPAGDVVHRGRKLKHGYERGATLLLAEHVQQALRIRQECEVMISRKVGEESMHVHRLSIINRLQPAFVVRLCMHRSEKPKPSMTVFYRVTNPLTDFCKRINPADFIPIEQAHVLNVHKTKYLAQRLVGALSCQSDSHYYDVHGPFGFPLYAHQGILSSMVTIEISIDDERKMTHLYEIITTAIIDLLQHHVV